MYDWVLKKVFGTKHQRELKRLRPLVEAISSLEPEMKKLSDTELQAKTATFKQKLENGASVDDLLIEVFATVREAGRRVLGMRHYDVQLIGGTILHQGKIAEMKTGEGKTLVATLPVYLNALEGKGVHVVTVNDYLARRDAEWMGKLYNFLGMSVGIVTPMVRDSSKKQAYDADITYGQNNEFGFDYLRDNMKFSIYDYVQRDLHYAIVDEVDSILIDEARTPLIISGPGETASEKYTQIDEIIPRLRLDEHYTIDEKARQATLTEEGIELAQKLLGQKGLLEVQNLYEPVNLETLHILQQCLRAHALYKRDHEYMVSEDGKVLIIDEFTGRVLPGRRWSDGLHQAVEAKERVPIEDENLTLATISFQNLFRLYDKLAGMTGTADTEASEFHQIYELDVSVIPTNEPVRRIDHEDLVYKSEKEKFRAVADEIADAHGRGQPVLVGTTSVEKSDALSRMLERRKIPHNVLNAKQHEREAYIVAQAGVPGSVTVATNMAGRGTDIVLGGNPEMLARMEVLEKSTPELLEDQQAFDAAVDAAIEHYKTKCEQHRKDVKDAGGLHIIGTERHESRRVDNQLRGRSGRQGDPGSSRFFLSLEDDLMRIFAGDKIQGMMDRLGMEENVPIEHKWVSKAVENAQKKVEERNFDIRKTLLEYDDVLNQQRKSVYTLRKQVLMGQYRTVPTEDELEKGKKPEPVVTEANEDLAVRTKPILERMVKFHAAPPPPDGANEDQIQAWRQKAMELDFSQLGEVRSPPGLSRDVYWMFGCQILLGRDPKKVLERLEREVPLSLTEQQERLLDLADEIIGTMVQAACPPNKHYEDWDVDGLKAAYKDQFGIEATGAEQYTDSQDLAEKLYGDAEKILLKKEKEFGEETFLRLFRNLYLEEIDKQWIEHLQAMDHLRDGIGLRGYGQKDPKQEYKLEGFDMFMEMTQSVKSSIANKLFRLERVREEDVERIEARRRQQSEARQRAMRANHPEAQGDGDGEGPKQVGAGGASMPQRVETVRRERPKIGRNDPCWCGSGKKYKQCHWREDQQSAAAQ